MSLLLAILTLVTAAADGDDLPIMSRTDQVGSMMFTCNFEEQVDPNVDGWPDGWSRPFGIGFPMYIPIEIVEEQSASGTHCLQVELDGGGSRVFSPTIDIDAMHDYVAGAMVRTADLKYDEVFITLTLFDSTGKRLETFASERLHDTDRQWVPLKIGPIVPVSDDVAQAKIGLYVTPGQREDLRATVQWDDVWLSKTPHISLTTNNRLNLYADPGSIEIYCEASGYSPERNGVTFRLEDAVGNVLAEVDKKLQARHSADRFIGLMDQGLSGSVKGTAEWMPPVPGPGFYRIFAKVEGVDVEDYQREMNLAVIQPFPDTEKERFGWSLPDGGHPLTRGELAYVISQSGVKWVKYPIWFDAKAPPEEINEIVSFCQRLGKYGIQIVGLLHDPPEDVKAKIPHTTLSAAEIFSSQSDSWFPSLEQVVMRMATQIRWWQLGRDEDQSLIGYPNLDLKIGEVKRLMDRVGFDVQVGFGWSWLYELPGESQSTTISPLSGQGANRRTTVSGAGTEHPSGMSAKLPWRFVMLSSPPPLTADEITTNLQALEKNSPGSANSPLDESVQHWMMLCPIDRNDYDYRTRVVDLVTRMIAAHIQEADAAFVPEPFNTDHGLMNDDGTPGELFLPWRTTALMLGGTKYTGSIRLPGGSNNMVFQRGDTGVMVVWNDKPTQEKLFVGHEARQVTLWGQITDPPMDGNQQIFELGPYPSFIIGSDMDIVRWRQSFKLSKTQIPSVFNADHENGFEFTNTIDRGISGRATIHAPEVWGVEPSVASFVLGAGESVKKPFTISLPYNATSGTHPVRIDMEIQTNRPKRFSVYRDISIGAGDVYILATTRLNAKGELEVHQTFVNESSQRVSYSCRLIIPGHREQKSEIIGLDQGSDEYTYFIPDGESLIDQTLWIRATEIGGVRTLIQKFPAKRH